MIFKIMDLRLYPICPELAGYTGAPAWLNTLSPQIETAVDDYLLTQKEIDLSKFRLSMIDHAVTDTDAKAALGKANTHVENELSTLLQRYQVGYDTVKLPYAAGETYVYRPTSNRHETVTRVMLYNSTAPAQLVPWEIPIPKPPQIPGPATIMVRPVIVLTVGR